MIIIVISLGCCVQEMKMFNYDICQPEIQRVFIWNQRIAIWGAQNPAVTRQVFCMQVKARAFYEKQERQSGGVTIT